MKIEVKDFNENIWNLVGKEWMLISGGNVTNHNAMTASWGGFGVMFSKDIAWCVIRPQRHTKKFVDNNDCFTLTFFDKKYQDSLANIYGKISGSNTDKDALSNFTPIETGVPNTVSYKEARITIVCKKLLENPITESSFCDKSIINTWYPEKDFHTLYMGEIISIEIN